MSRVARARGRRDSGWVGIMLKRMVEGRVSQRSASWARRLGTVGLQRAMPECWRRVRSWGLLWGGVDDKDEVNDDEEGGGRGGVGGGGLGATPPRTSSMSMRHWRVASRGEMRSAWVGVGAGRMTSPRWSWRPGRRAAVSSGVLGGGGEGEPEGVGERGRGFPVVGGPGGGAEVEAAGHFAFVEEGEHVVLGWVTLRNVGILREEGGGK